MPCFCPYGIDESNIKSEKLRVQNSSNLKKGIKSILKIYKYTDNKGFTTAEIIISIAIIIIFTTIITSAFYNYYVSAQSKNRKTIATNIIIDVIENVEMMKYEETSQDTVNTLIQTLKDNGIIQNRIFCYSYIKKI